MTNTPNARRGRGADFQGWKRAESNPRSNVHALRTLPRFCPTRCRPVDDYEIFRLRYTLRSLFCFVRVPSRPLSRKRNRWKHDRDRDEIRFNDSLSVQTKLRDDRTGSRGAWNHPESRVIIRRKLHGDFRARLPRFVSRFTTLPTLGWGERNDRGIVGRTIIRPFRTFRSRYPAARIRRFETSGTSANRCKLYRERRYSRAVFLASGTFEPANAGRRSKAHGQLEQRAAAGRCNGQSGKGSIEGNEERTNERGDIATDQTEGRNGEGEEKKEETRRE